MKEGTVVRIPKYSSTPESTVLQYEQVIPKHIHVFSLSGGSIILQFVNTKYLAFPFFEVYHISAAVTSWINYVLSKLIHKTSPVRLCSHDKVIGLQGY